PGPGACGGQFTANTMATVGEILGICPMGMSDIPAMDDNKDRVSYDLGQIMMNMIEQDIRPSKIITRASLENAVASIAASGGSTNGVLHTLAFAREAGIPFTIDDIENISRNTPLICDLKPTGRFVATDMYRAGGIRLLAQRLVEGGYADGSTLTVTGRTLAEDDADARDTSWQEVIGTWQNHTSRNGGLRTIQSTIAPYVALVKVKGTDPRKYRVLTRVFGSECAALDA